MAAKGRRKQAEKGKQMGADLAMSSPPSKAVTATNGGHEQASMEFENDAEQAMELDSSHDTTSGPMNGSNPLQPDQPFVYLDGPDVRSPSSGENNNWRHCSMQTLTPPIGASSPPPDIEAPKDHTGSNNNSNNKRSRPSSSDGEPFRPRFSKELLDKASDRINLHFDAEIVLKHRELEEIENEMGKTRACLEQLRRCSLIPFPGHLEDLANGTGPVLAPASGGSIPQYAPAWGVVDGPYTRHYSQWLLPDPRFDGGELYTPIAGQVHASASGRPQRTSVQKAQQTRTTGSIKCFYTKKDGSLVKLVCNACHRENFSSPQGFINHCRISHGNEFLSHEAAADVCGVSVDDVEAAEYHQSGRSARASVTSGPFLNTRNSSAPTSAVSYDSPYQYAAAPTPQPRKVSHAKPKPSRGSSKVNGGNSSFSGPLTPPFEPDTPMSTPKPPTSNLKKFLQRHSLAVDDLDGMVDDVVNRTDAIDEDDEGDNESEDEAALPDGSRRVKKESPAAAALIANGRTAAPSRTATPRRTIVRLKLNTGKLLELGHVIKKEGSGDTIDRGTPLVSAGKNVALIPRTPLQMDICKDDIEPLTDEEEATSSFASAAASAFPHELMSLSDGTVQQRRLLPKLALVNGDGYEHHTMKRNKLASTLPPPMPTRRTEQL